MWMILLGVGIAAIMVSRRRALRSARTLPPMVRPAPPVIRPVLVRHPLPPVVRPVAGRPARQYVWGVAVVLLVTAAALFSLVRLSEADAPPAPVAYRYEPAIPVVDRRPASKKPWWKAPAPPQVRHGEVVRTWTIEQPTFPAASEVNTRDELYEKIADRLKWDLLLHRPPSPKFLNNAAYVRVEEVGREEHQDRDPKLGELVTVRYGVELTSAGLAELDREQRADRAGNRMEFAARGLGILTVLLGAIAAYVRLDDWTKGYYSGRLFLALTAIVLTAGAGIIHGF